MRALHYRPHPAARSAPCFALIVALDRGTGDAERVTCTKCRRWLDRHGASVIP